LLRVSGWFRLPKGHYTFDDKFIALDTDLELSDPAGADGLGKVQDQLKKLTADYAAGNAAKLTVKKTTLLTAA
jgi:hypothetical protein